MRSVHWRGVVRALALLVALGAAVNCGADDSAAFGDNESDPSVPGGKGTGGSSSGSAGSGGQLPPEEELESSFLSPVSTGRYVWVANPSSGRVAFIDATTLSIKLVEAGNGPTYLAALPSTDADRAIVLNVLSLDATVLTARAGELETSSLAVPSGGNTWAIAASGRYAIAWTDAGKIKDADPIDGFQDLTVLDLDKGTSWPLSVGYRPVAVSFSQDESRAFVVTQDGVAVVELGDAPAVTKNIALTDSPLKSASTRDVAITPDGSLALVRLDGASAVTVVRLDDGVRSEVPLDGVVTDLDLSADGQVAVAVVRDKGQVALLRVPDVASDPSAVTVLDVGSADNVVGSASLAAASPVAFLYSNAVSNAVLTVVDAAAPEPAPKPVLLRAPVSAVFPTRDGASALVLHTKGPEGSKTSYPAALSVVRVSADLPAKIVGLDAPVAAVAVSPEGNRAVVAVGEEKSSVWRAMLVRFDNQQVQEHALPSPPIAAGIVAQAGRAFVAQKHPEGRVSFIDLETGEVRTLTGFELAAQVVYGSKK